MSRSYRCFIFAFIGWLALCGSAPEKSDDNKKTNTTQAATQSDPSASSTVKTVKKIDTSEYEKPCKEGWDNRTSDLCAQWKAADATRDAAEWAKWQLLLAIVGTCGLLASIWYTRRAVLTAIKSNENAQDALIHAKKMAAVELRPYVHVDEVNYVQSDIISKRGSILIRIKNFGSTPATRFRVEAGADLRHTRNLNSSSSVFITQRRYPTVDELPPGHTATITLPAPPTGAFHRTDSAHLCCVQFWYSDKFGAEYMRWETYIADNPTSRTATFRFFAHNQGPVEQQQSE